MSKLLLILFLFVGVHLSAQRSTWKKLGKAEKLWVFTHPFVAKKAFRISQQVLQKMDSLKGIDYFKRNTLAGSKADAVRHAYWMAELSYQIGSKRALSLGKAHEEKNRDDFEKGSLEESFLPDEAAMKMDLLNNQEGVKVGINSSGEGLLVLVLEVLHQGKLFYIKQNNEGDFLDKRGQLIPLDEWSGLWQNDRVVIPSNL